jgi:hypothetical protein
MKALLPVADYHAEGNLQTAKLVASVVNSAAKHGIYRANCLERSLTLWWLLRRRGINTALRIGVRKYDSKFEAHAWIEYQNDVLNDSNDVSEQYSAFNGHFSDILPVGIPATSWQ